VATETTQTSLMVRTKRRGYTLIELMVVTVLLALFSALVWPSFVGIRDGQKRRAFYTSVVDLAGVARELAITRNATMYLSADTSQNMVVIKKENDDTSYTPADGNAGTPTASSTGGSSNNSNNQRPTEQSNVGTAQNDRSNDPTMITLPMPTGMQFGNFQLAGANSDASSWRLRFFADGTCDGGAVEFNLAGNVKSLVVNNHGSPKMTDGTIPDTSTLSWSAGNYVQRQQ